MTTTLTTKPSNHNIQALPYFNEESRHALYEAVRHQAAIATGIECMAARVIDSGEQHLIDEILALAMHHSESMRNLSITISQLKIHCE